MYISLERYDDAEKYMKRLRNYEPPVYNHRRLAEFPIPDVGKSNQAMVPDNSIATNHSDDSMNSTLNESINPNENIEITQPSLSNNATDESPIDFFISLFIYWMLTLYLTASWANYKILFGVHLVGILKNKMIINII